MKDIVDLIARVFLAFIFFYEAYDSIFYFKQTKTTMTNFGLTWNQDMLLFGAIFVLVLGGILLLLGYRSGFGVVLLLMYWIPVTFIVHSFWNDPFDCIVNIPCQEIEEPYRRIQGVLFMKNLAIIGGLLMVWVNGSGRYSIKRLFATTRVPEM